jgi:transcriptional regulator NrdR family protein
MDCPKCGVVSSVTDSRPKKKMGVRVVQRRRQCRCGNRFVTYEACVEAFDNIKMMHDIKGMFAEMAKVIAKLDDEGIK